jgi:hypothetical protein
MNRYDETVIIFDTLFTWGEINGWLFLTAMVMIFITWWRNV